MQRDVDITTDCIWLKAFDFSVANDDPHGFTTIQTGRIDLNSLTRKHPADRQGFKTSLGKPFLMPINRKTVLRRQVVERSKRRNQVRFRVKPNGQFGVHQFMEQLLAVIRGHGKLLGDLGEVGSSA
jgi:hypothetical protein